MKLLIQPTEIGTLLPVGTLDNIEVPETTIITAQSRYIQPVLGSALYDAIEDGRYPDLVESLLKPALALYAYYLAVPAIAMRTGSLGIVRFKSDYYTPADSKSIAQLRHHIRSEADAAIDLLIKHIENNLSAFPEYVRAKNIRQRVSITGGIVL